MPVLDEVIIRIKALGGKLAAADLGAAESGMKGLHSTAKTAAGVAGIGALAFGLKDVTEAAIKFQDKQAQLANALKNTGQYSKENVQLVSEAADNLAQHGGFDPATAIEGMQRLIRAHETVAESIKNQVLVTDVARAGHVSYERALRMVMNVEQGRNTGLTRLGVIIKAAKDHQDALSTSTKHATAAQKEHAKALDAQETKTKTLATLWQRFGGSAETYSKTAAGGANNVRNSIDILGQRVGTFLLPVINKFIQGLSRMVGFLNSNKDALYALLTVFGAVAALWGATQLISFVKWLKLAAETTKITAAAQWILNAAQTAWVWIWYAVATAADAAGVSMVVATGGIILIVAALAAGIYLLVTHWKQVKQAAADVFKWMKNAVADVVNWIGKHWKLLVLIFFGVFGLIVDIVVTHFTAIRKFVTGVVDAIISVVRTIMKPVKAVFDFIVSNVVMPWVRAVIAPIRGLVTTIITVWNTLKAPLKAVWDWILGAIHTVGAAIVTAIRWVVDQIEKLWGKISGPIKSILHAGSSIIGKVGGAAGSVLHFAGIGHGASGGWAPHGGMFEVGEHGREHVLLPPASLIVPNAYANTGMGGGGQALENHVTFKIGQKEFAKAIAWTTAKEKATR